MNILLLAALLVFALTLFLLLENMFACWNIPLLDTVAPINAAELPFVSVIIPALNEEQHIEQALNSVLALTYPRLEIIALDDRSTDATPAILERIAAQHPKLRVVRIQELPPGWLGKTHALHLGAEQAQGEFLLFTDADVRLAPDTVSRAVTRMMEQHLDHLCLIFRLDLPSPLLAMLAADSLSGLLTVFKPWRTLDPDPRYFFGTGGFNLVRRSLYAKCGGHRPIRLCPVDDILLGRLVKECGGRQECLNGRHFVSVPWYGSVSEMIRGLRKNAFAALDYRLSGLAAATLFVLCGQILPFWGLLLADGWLRRVCGLTVAASALSLLVSIRALGLNLFCLRWFLLTPYLKLCILWQSALAALSKGGVAWRGTLYPLDELRRHMQPVSPWRKFRRE
ncbi:glycosyltransferase [Candidatus Electronema sp. TJ]|uniref:glycosyltransferase n=1 Tax=Candidatus Electronema sp. TJ TaxID=3401573 RepID=UPI003AA861E0